MSKHTAAESEAVPKDRVPMAIMARAAGVGFWDWDLATDDLFLSTEWKQQLGYRDDEIPGRQEEWERRLHPDDRVAALACVHSHVANPDTAYESEFRLRHKDGSYRWILARGEALRDDHGIVVRMVGCHLDVTDRKEKERSLRASLEQYANLVQNVNGIVWEAEALTRQVLYISPLAETVLGYPRGRWLDEPDFWRQHIHADDRERVMQIVTESDARLEPHQLEYRMTAADGRVVWFHDFVRVMPRNGASTLLRGLMIDVTAEKAAEESERRQQSRLRLSVELARLGCWEIDMTTRIMTLDDQMFRFLRTTAEDEGGYSMPLDRYTSKFLHPDDMTALWGELPAARATQDPHYARQLEHRWLRADGTIGYASVCFSMVKDATSRPLRWFGVVQDITERREAEQRLRTSTALLEQTGALAGVGGWEFDVQTSALHFTPQTVRMHDLPAGYTPTMPEAIGFYDPADRPMLEAVVADGIANGTPWDLELPFTTAKGRRILVRAQGAAERRDGQVVRLFGAFHNITEQRQTEQRLKRLLQGESLLAAVSQRFIDMDPSEIDDGIRDALRPVAEFAGVVRTSLFVYSSDGTRIMNTHEWCADPADSQLEALRDLEVGQYQFFHQQLREHRVVRLTRMGDLPPGSSERRWAETHGFRPTLLFPLTSRSRLIGVVGFYGRFGEEREFDLDVVSSLASFSVSLANVISRKNTEEERVFLERQLLQAQKMEAIGTLAGGIAHDFNNILGAIIGNLGLARMEAEMGKAVDESLLEVERAAERAAALVQQILAFSRHQDHERRAIVLGPVLDEAVRFVRATIPSVVAIETTLRRDVPDVVADPTQMHQILLNLCANAWHAMEDSPGRITIALTAVNLTRTAARRIDGIGPGRYACLTVADTGRGMDEATLKRIFDPFFTTKTVGKGTGLGMSVVHGIVRSHHGGIVVTSDPDRGTTVKIYLPAARSSAGATTEVPALAAGAGEHVLLVDDEESIVRVMTRLLERIGYRVTAFSRPQEALRAFLASPDDFHLVLTDYEMPEVTGLALARELLQIRPQIPIVLCSGRIREQARIEAEALGIRRFITKPCPTSVMSRVLREALVDRPPG